MYISTVLCEFHPKNLYLNLPTVRRLLSIFEINTDSRHLQIAGRPAFESVGYTLQKVCHLIHITSIKYIGKLMSDPVNWTIILLMSNEDNGVFSKWYGNLVSSLNSGNVIKHLNFPKMIFTEFSESRKYPKEVLLAQTFYIWQ